MAPADRPLPPRVGDRSGGDTPRGGGWERGFISVPPWVLSALALGVLLGVALTALVLIPPAQRPHLEPAPTSTPSSTAR